MESKELDPAHVEQRRTDLMGIVGLWRDRTNLPDTESHIRGLRNDTRLERLEALKTPGEL